MTVIVELKTLPHFDGLRRPFHGTDLAAGADLRAAVPESEPVTLESMERRLIPTGLAIALPAGYEAQIRPRSGLAIKHGISIPNTPGTIDADYRGELRVPLINLGQEPFMITRGDRIAQMVVSPVIQPEFRVVLELSTTERGEGGFGSTGVKG
ncbi:MAG: dUTP diphosphatase [Hyphomonadaceae bacterium]|nr:dUTP diphosphatase [Hyphomonadaceae bacterium]MBC6413042.1 dUTP diphosphatase [Hyphomonadaceae bacterium]